MIIKAGEIKSQRERQISLFNKEYLRLEKEAAELASDVSRALNRAEREYKELCLHEVEVEASAKLLELLEYCYGGQQPGPVAGEPLVDEWLRQAFLRKPRMGV